MQRSDTFSLSTLPHATIFCKCDSILRSDYAHVVCDAIKLQADGKLGSGGSSLFGHAT